MRLTRSTPPRRAARLARALSIALLAAAPFLGARTSFAQQPSATEQRFREAAVAVRARGLDGTTRDELARVAALLDADLAAPGTPADALLRLLPARIQVALWLDDEAMVNASFERLLAISPAPEAIAIAWARELVAAADFQRAVTVLNGRTFNGSRATDANVLLGQAYTGLHLFNEGQAALNTPSANRTPEQQAAITAGTMRTQTLRDMWEKEVGAMARDQAKDDLPLVELTTPKGVLSIELFEDQAPNTVANFIEHVERGSYAGTSFHRLVRGFGIQGGDPSSAGGAAAGRGSGGWTIVDEGEREDRRAPLAGRLVAVKQRPVPIATEPIPNSAGSQFMILLTPAETLDRTYTTFGRVVDGLDVARRLRPEDTILSAQVLRKRDREYKAVRNDVAPEGTGPTGDYSLPEPPPPPRPAARPATPARAPTATGPAGTTPVQPTPVPVPPPAARP